MFSKFSFKRVPAKEENVNANVFCFVFQAIPFFKRDQEEGIRYLEKKRTFEEHSIYFARLDAKTSWLHGCLKKRPPHRVVNSQEKQPSTCPNILPRCRS